MLPCAIWQLDGEVTSDFIIFSSKLLQQALMEHGYSKV